MPLYNFLFHINLNTIDIATTDFNSFQWSWTRNYLDTILCFGNNIKRILCWLSVEYRLQLQHFVSMVLNIKYLFHFAMLHLCTFSISLYTERKLLLKTQNLMLLFLFFFFIIFNNNIFSTLNFIFYPTVTILITFSQKRGVEWHYFLFCSSVDMTIWENEKINCKFSRKLLSEYRRRMVQHLYNYIWNICNIYVYYLMVTFSPNTENFVIQWLYQ